MSFKIKVLVAFVAIFSMNSAMAAGACYGKVSLLWVDKDESLNFNLEPTGLCGCNFSEGNSRGFSVPRSQENRDEQYSALLAAFMADKVVSSWHDWTKEDGSQRCVSHNIALGKW